MIERTENDPHLSWMSFVVAENVQSSLTALFEYLDP